MVAEKAKVGEIEMSITRKFDLMTLILDQTDRLGDNTAWN